MAYIRSHNKHPNEQISTIIQVTFGKNLKFGSDFIYSTSIILIVTLFWYQNIFKNVTLRYYIILSLIVHYLCFSSDPFFSLVNISSSHLLHSLPEAVGCLFLPRTKHKKGMLTSFFPHTELIYLTNWSPTIDTLAIRYWVHPWTVRFNF